MVLQQVGLDKQTSTKKQIQTSVRAGQANMIYCTKFQQNIFNSTPVTVRRNYKTPPAAIPGRCTKAKATFRFN
jgi:hypothetical protein